MDGSLVRAFEGDNPSLAAIFRELRGKAVLYYPNPGNAGDSLIAAATYQIFRSFGIHPRLLSGPKDVKALKDEVVLLGGGGNLVPMYGGMASMLAALNGRSNRVVVMSHSVRGHDAVLTSLDDGFSLYCRELPSYEYVQSLRLRAHVGLSHDLAIYLDTDELLSWWRSDSGNEARFRSTLLKEGGTTAESVRDREVWCIRGGAERTIGRPTGNLDISAIFRAGVRPTEAETGAAMMIEFCKLPNSIVTNRLHAGVAAGLVGSPCRLLDNSYGKVSSVYAFSLRARFGALRLEAAGSPSVSESPQL
jgi:exopolysaccharide biosynthesis predicted pyruvyltransferase EpsI